MSSHRSRGVAVLGATALLASLGLAPSVGATPARVSHESTAPSMCNITQTKSLQGTVPTAIKFVNKTTGVVKVDWLSYTGARVYYDTIEPGASVVQRTWKTHPWIVLDSAGTCIGYVIAPWAEYDIGGSGSSTTTSTLAPSKKPTFTSVVCTISIGSAGSTCTAQVADATPQRSNPPTGTVTFSASSGSVGSSCSLSGTPGSPGIASCSVSYVPSANLVQGEPPPVSADYSGDTDFDGSAGISGYQPASVIVPDTVTAADITESPNSDIPTSEGIPTDLVNSNTFPVSADEALTVSGYTEVSSGNGANAIRLAKVTLIGSATFHLKPLASMIAKIELTAEGRRLLAKQRQLNVTLTVATSAQGRPTKVSLHHLKIKAAH